MSAATETSNASSSDTERISAEQAAIEARLVKVVLSSFDDCQDVRLKFLMQALVRHVHAFIREVRLSEAEWNRAIAFLNAAGQISDDTREEFVLLSDVLGASMQTVAVNNTAYENATEATVFGPFFAEGAPLIELGGDMSAGAAGQPCWVEGTITGTDGTAIPGARIEVWQADEKGFYDAQYDDHRVTGRAHLFADENGGYRFWGLTPTPYPIPDDGPVGKMLTAVGRSPMRAAHLHFMVTAENKRTLVTHIFVRGDELLARDTVFGVKESLIRDFPVQSAGTPTPDGRDLHGRDWTRTRFDIVLAPSAEAD